MSWRSGRSREQSQTRAERALARPPGDALRSAPTTRRRARRRIAEVIDDGVRHGDGPLRDHLHEPQRRAARCSIQFPIGVHGRPACRRSTPTTARCTACGSPRAQWFTDADDQRLAPAVIVNEGFWQQLGSPPLATHPTITLPGRAADDGGHHRHRRPRRECDTYPQLFILSSAWRADHAARAMRAA